MEKHRAYFCAGCDAWTLVCAGATDERNGSDGFLPRVMPVKAVIQAGSARCVVYPMIVKGYGSFTIQNLK
jgi:hypothetical protein